MNTYVNGAILDETQRAPQILSYLQQILGEGNQKEKFILTGSIYGGDDNQIGSDGFSILSWKETPNL